MNEFDLTQYINNYNEEPEYREIEVRSTGKKFRFPPEETFVEMPSITRYQTFWDRKTKMLLESNKVAISETRTSEAVPMYDTIIGPSGDRKDHVGYVRDLHSNGMICTEPFGTTRETKVTTSRTYPLDTSRYAKVLVEVVEYEVECEYWLDDHPEDFVPEKGAIAGEELCAMCEQLNTRIYHEWMKPVEMELIEEVESIEPSVEDENVSVVSVTRIQVID